MERVHQRHFDDASNGVEPLKKFDFSKLTTASFCLDSGLLPCDKCLSDARGNRISTGYYFGSDGKPVDECNLHLTVDWCRDSQSIAGMYCPEESVYQVSLFYENDRYFEHGDVNIEDSIFTYRNIDMTTAPVGVAPFYASSVPEGINVGYTVVDDGAPANRICAVHTQETALPVPEEGIIYDENGNPIEAGDNVFSGEDNIEGEARGENENESDGSEAENGESEDSVSESDSQSSTAVTEPESGAEDSPAEDTVQGAESTSVQPQDGTSDIPDDIAPSADSEL